MHKLSRAYIANAGHKLAWYDGIPLDFTDSATNDPTHTIYNLVNQGGKTTFLSLIFSCIRTARDEFLQTLSNPGQRFEDYFDKDGLPGIIALEWRMPGDLASSTRTVITGQIVVVRRSSEPVELDRWFFLIQGSGPVTLEDIPGPNLRCGPEQILASRDDVVTWLHKMRADWGEQVFYFTQNQADWAKALVAVGLDVELLKHQVDFNRKEGAMDEAFLSFKDEREFVRRFLMLTMDASRADQVREAVAAHCRRISTRKPLEEAMGQLLRFEGVYQPFSAAARAYGEAVLKQHEIGSRIASAVETLKHRVREKTALRTEQQELVRKQSEVAESAETKKVSALKNGEAYEDEQRLRGLRRAEGALQEASDALKGAERHVRLLNAAEILAEISARKLEVSELRSAIDKANGEVAPIRVECGQRAALLREGLVRARQKALNEEGEAKEEASKLSQRLESLAGEEKAILDLRTAAQKEGITANASLTEASRRRRSLEDSKAIQPDESASDALVRLEQDRARHEQAAGEFDAIAVTADEAASACGEQREALLLNQAEAVSAACRFEGELEKGLTQQDALRTNRQICRAISADVADPDSEVLGGLLDAHIQRVQADATQAELDYARLDEDAQSIRDTGLAGRDAEVTKIVRALAESGIKNTQAYAQYLAAVFPEGELARSLVESDPARFLGIAVPTREQLDQVRTLVPTLPGLTRPVVVSLVTDKPAAMGDTSIVLGPAENSLFNLEAAARKGERIEEELVAQEAGRNQARRVLEEAQKAKTALDSYLQDFGRAKLEELSAEATRERARAETCGQQLEEVSVLIRSERDKAEQARRSANEERRKLADVAGQIREVTDFRSNFDVHIPTWEGIVEAKRREENGLTDSLNALLSTKPTIEKEILAHNVSANGHAQEAQRIYLSLAELQDVDKEFDAKAVLDAQPRTVTELQTLYRASRDALEAAEKKQTAPLLAKKEAVEQGLTAANARYTDVGAGLPVQEVSVFLHVNFNQQRAKAEGSVDTAKARKDRCLTEKGAASEKLDDFRRNRKHPEHSIVGIDEVSEDGLVEAISAASVAVSNATEEVAQAKTAVQQAKQRAVEFEKYVDSFSNAMKPIAGLVPENLESTGTVAQLLDHAFLDATVAVDEAARLSDEHRLAAENSQKQWKRSQHLFENVRLTALSEDFKKSDVELADVLRRNTLEEALGDYERIENGIVQRKAVISDELAKMDEDFERAVTELSQLVGDALSLLRRATETLKLPNHVPRVAGRTVLTMQKSIFGLSKEARRERLGPLMSQLAADGNIPESGAALATRAVMELAGHKLGLKLLKVVEMVDEQYVSIERLSKSGAESISMAILLYFVIARLRYEQRAQSRVADGGVLILDNPFSKATARPVWEIILGLADAMNLQLIIATGIQEYETLSVFKRFLRLAKNHQNTATGRMHIGMADYNFKSEARAA
ncbi:hypothetical protein [Cupriavidus sp. TMH.W2]|uniref:hypothetical protein n=1 Tax=Cupriavidus sp. TMH.W2 TaxID=3434465 RepID=UPI003D7838C2